MRIENRLFPPRKPKALSPLLAGLLKLFPDDFRSPEAAQRFAQLIWFPPSRAWRYQLNGKSGNTFVLNLLFEIEYGTRFSCRVDPGQTGNLHPDMALFSMLDARLYSNALQQQDRPEAFLGFPGLSLATVREPCSRLLSAFFYLSRSHEVGDRRFLPERLRINALAGMDWDRDAGTPEGFARFVAYIGAIADGPGADTLDAHWLPQALHIRPAIYKPDLVGRTEDLPRFARDLSARLDRPLPADMDGLRTNKSKRPDTRAFLTQPGVCATIEKVYAADFDLFEYPRPGA